MPGLSCSMQDLVPQPGRETGPPALGAWSLTHWTIREVPHPVFLTPCFYHLEILNKFQARGLASLVSFCTGSCKWRRQSWLHGVDDVWISLFFRRPRPRSPLPSYTHLAWAVCTAVMLSSFCHQLGSFPHFWPGLEPLSPGYSSLSCVFLSHGWSTSSITFWEKVHGR